MWILVWRNQENEARKNKDAQICDEASLHTELAPCLSPVGHSADIKTETSTQQIGISLRSEIILPET